MNNFKTIGNKDLLNKTIISFSGSRHPSQIGIVNTKKLAKQCVNNGFVVASGYANGIDTEAHHTALKQGGETIIVLAEGINNFRAKTFMLPYWNKNNVLIISQFENDDKWSVKNALARNKTIVSICEFLIAIEPRETGGTRNAINVAIKKNKPYFTDVNNLSIYEIQNSIGLNSFFS